MKTFCVLLLSFSLAMASAQKKIEVVATLPDYGSIAQAIGGDRINVTTLARGTEDAHFVDPKPSFVRTLNKANLLIEGGAELEIGWLPPLVGAARNKAIVPGAPGNLMLSKSVELIDVAAGPIDRSMGDVHPSGNPHFNLDPVNGKAMASAITEKLATLAPAHAQVFRANQQQFEQELDRRFAEWKKLMGPLKDTQVITYHKSFDYLLRRFNLGLAGTIEPKPGVEPSPTHINALVPKARAAAVKYVIIEPNRSRGTPEYIAKAAGAKLLVLPVLVGGHPRVKTYIELLDYNIRQLAGER